MRRLAVEDRVASVVDPQLRPGEAIEIALAGETKTLAAKIANLLTLGRNCGIGETWLYVVLTNERVFVINPKISRRGGDRSKAIVLGVGRDKASMESYRGRRWPFAPRLVIAADGQRFDLFLAHESKGRGADLARALG